MNNQELKPSLPTTEVERLSSADPIREKASKLSREERTRLENVARAMIGLHGNQAAHLIAR